VTERQPPARTRSRRRPNGCREGSAEERSTACCNPRDGAASFPHTAGRSSARPRRSAQKSHAISVSAASPEGQTGGAARVAVFRKRLFLPPPVKDGAIFCHLL